MAVSKIERLMNLVIALLSTRQYLTADRIRANVAGYDPDASDEAFSRMFERDKAELRDLGIPLETGMTSAFSAIEGYRINRDAYELPDIDLTSEEAAAVAVAVQLWESPELASTAHSGLQKLRAAGVTVDLDATTSTAALPARSRGSEPALGKLMAAIDAGRAVRFPHHSAPTEPYTQRDVEPWGIVTRTGRWYLVGHDRDRGAERTFRISRIGDDVVAYGPPNTVCKPDGIDLRQVVDRIIGSPVTGTATVWVADGHAHDLRRLGTRTGRRRIGDRDGDVLELTVRSREWTARLIAGHGPDALVLEPYDLRADVVARLTAAR